MVVYGVVSDYRNDRPGIEKETNNPDVIYLGKLRFSVKIIDPVTYVLSDDDDDNAGE